MKRFLQFLWTFLLSLLALLVFAGGTACFVSKSQDWKCIGWVLFVIFILLHAIIAARKE